jgi:hypothetical protein
MAVKIETILTDDLGNRIVVTQEYSGDLSLQTPNIEATEQLVWKAKQDIGLLVEQELWVLNQKMETEKKKNLGFYLNGKNKVFIRTLNGKQSFENQRYITGDKLLGCSFLDSYCNSRGSSNGYQSLGLLELLSEYACKLSYADTSALLDRFIGERIYTGSQIQHKILALEPQISAHLQSPYSNLQLSFNFVDPQVDLYDKNALEVCYLDDAIGVTKQKSKRSDPTYEKKSKYVQTDVVLVQNRDHSYHYFSENREISGGLDLETQVICHLSTVFHSVYGSIPFVAITDGARSIRCRIERMVGSRACIILDWYHLEKKVWHHMSRLGQTKTQKEKHAQELLHYLWNGYTTDALIYTEQAILVPLARQPFLEEFQDYLLKHQTEIIDYDTRWRCTGKCIGSGRGEKANDQMIAKHQKINGKSWSEQGSHAIAALQALKLNHQWQSFWKVAA